MLLKWEGECEYTSVTLERFCGPLASIAVALTTVGGRVVGFRFNK